MVRKVSGLTRKQFLLRGVGGLVLGVGAATGFGLLAVESLKYIFDDRTQGDVARNPGGEVLEKKILDSLGTLGDIEEQVVSRLKGVKEPIPIYNYNELQRIGRDDLYPLGGDYVLTADINCPDAYFQPIGNENAPFMGTFNGDGRVIRSLRMSGGEKETIGLFRHVGKSAFDKKNPIIANVILENVDISGDDLVAGIVGINRGRVYKCEVRNGKINSTYDAAALIGINLGDLVKGVNCARVFGRFNAAGLVCSNNAYEEDNAMVPVFTNRANIIDSFNYGSVRTKEGKNNGMHVAGLVCHNSGKVVRSGNYGNVIGPLNAGGAVSVNHILGILYLVEAPGNVVALDRCAGGLAAINNGMIMDCIENSNVSVNPDLSGNPCGTVIGEGFRGWIEGNYSGSGILKVIGANYGVERRDK